jgi:hypothetical protein
MKKEDRILNEFVEVTNRRFGSSLKTLSFLAPEPGETTTGIPITILCLYLIVYPVNVSTPSMKYQVIFFIDIMLFFQLSRFQRKTIKDRDLPYST